MDKCDATGNSEARGAHTAVFIDRTCCVQLAMCNNTKEILEILHAERNNYGQSYLTVMEQSVCQQE